MVSVRSVKVHGLVYGCQEIIKKHKSSIVERIALERQADGKRVDFPFQKHYPLAPLGYQSLFAAILQSFLFQHQASLRSENNREHSKLKTKAREGH